MWLYQNYVDLISTKKYKH